MSNRSWKIALRQGLLRAQPTEGLARVAVLGIGQPLAGDDGLGVLVARRLRSKHLEPEWLILAAGTAPEVCTGTLRRFRPHLVVMIDAVDMGRAAGHIAWFDRWSADGVTASTHGLPLNILADYLRSELGCTVVLLGVQPQSLQFADQLSRPVRRAAAALVAELAHAAARSGATHTGSETVTAGGCSTVSR